MKNFHSMRGKIAIVLISLFLASCSSGPSGPTEDLTPIVIDAFGNSTTVGIGDTRSPAGYPFQLEQLLKPSHPNAIVVNRGVEGERTSKGVRRLGPVLDSDKPDYVLILEGINNVGDGTSLASMVNHLGEMIRMVKGSGGVPLIASLPPVAKKGYSNERIMSANSMIRALAGSEGIVFVDLHAAFMEDGDYTLLLGPDGLHPNSLGYDLMAEEWYESLLTIL